MNKKINLFLIILLFVCGLLLGQDVTYLEPGESSTFRFIFNNDSPFFTIPEKENGIKISLPTFLKSSGGSRTQDLPEIPPLGQITSDDITFKVAEGTSTETEGFIKVTIKAGSGDKWVYKYKIDICNDNTGDGSGGGGSSGGEGSANEDWFANASYGVLFDHSSSMGEPIIPDQPYLPSKLDQAKGFVKQGFAFLDFFSNSGHLIKFTAGASNVVYDDLSELFSEINGLSANGLTDIGAAISMCGGQFPLDMGGTMVLITDGYNTVGTDVGTLQILDNLLAVKPIRMHCIGVGLTPKHDLLCKLAERTGGSYQPVPNSRLNYSEVTLLYLQLLSDMLKFTPIFGAKINANTTLRQDEYTYTAPIDPYASDAIFHLAWEEIPNSNDEDLMSIEVIAPNGVVIDETYAENNENVKYNTPWIFNPDDPLNAYSIMVSDMQNHPEFWGNWTINVTQDYPLEATLLVSGKSSLNFNSDVIHLDEYGTNGLLFWANLKNEDENGEFFVEDCESVSATIFDENDEYIEEIFMDYECGGYSGTYHNLMEPGDYKIVIKAESWDEVNGEYYQYIKKQEHYVHMKFFPQALIINNDNINALNHWDRDVIIFGNVVANTDITIDDDVDVTFKTDASLTIGETGSITAGNEVRFLGTESMQNYIEIFGGSSFGTELFVENLIFEMRNTGGQALLFDSSKFTWSQLKIDKGQTLVSNGIFNASRLDYHGDFIEIQGGYFCDSRILHEDITQSTDSRFIIGTHAIEGDPEFINWDFYSEDYLFSQSIQLEGVDFYSIKDCHLGKGVPGFLLTECAPENRIYASSSENQNLNCRIEGNFFNNTVGKAIVLNHTDCYYIAGNQIQEADNGIFITESDNDVPTLNAHSIRNNGIGLAELENNQSYGIKLENIEMYEILDNTITLASRGIYIDDCAGNMIYHEGIIKDNTITGAGSSDPEIDLPAVELYHVQEYNIEGNIIRQNIDDGIKVSQSPSSYGTQKIHLNEIYCENGGYASGAAVKMSNCSDYYIDDNTIKNYTTGIQLYNVPGVQNFKISNNYIGTGINPVVKGVLCVYSGNFDIFNNKISAQEIGIDLSSCGGANGEQIIMDNFIEGFTEADAIMLTNVENSDLIINKIQECASGVTLENPNQYGEIRFINNEFYDIGDYCVISVYKIGSCSIENNTINTAGRGVSVAKARDAFITNNTIQQIHNSAAITCWEIEELSIDGNNLENCFQDGILVGSSGAMNVVIKDNDILNNNIEAVDPIFDEFSAICVERCDNFVIESNTIDNSRHGIQVIESGVKECKFNFIKKNVFPESASEPNSYYGIRLYHTNAVVTDNVITNNQYGINAARNCKIILRKDDITNDTEATQVIYENTKDEVLVYADSWPVEFSFNAIYNNPPLPEPEHKLVCCPDPENFMLSPENINISKNYWGEAFDPGRPENYFDPASFSFDPTWIPETVIIPTNDPALEMYNLAHQYIAEENYDLAYITFKELIALYPESPYAAAAAKEMLELPTGGGRNSFVRELRDYYLGDPDIRNHAHLAKLGDYLANYCSIIMKDYSTAIAWFEEQILYPDRPIDAIYAEIDLGYLYLQMEDDSTGTRAIGKLTEYKPVSQMEFNNKRSNYLMDLFDYEPLHTLQNIIPSDLQLSQNYPNPFNPKTEIKFSIPESSNCKLTIYNVKGQIVKTLVDDELTAGHHSIVWDGKNSDQKEVSSGIYFYRLESNNQKPVSRKMLLLK